MNVINKLPGFRYLPSKTEVITITKQGRNEIVRVFDHVKRDGVKVTFNKTVKHMRANDWVRVAVAGLVNLAAYNAVSSLAQRWNSATKSLKKVANFNCDERKLFGVTLKSEEFLGQVALFILDFPRKFVCTASFFAINICLVGGSILALNRYIVPVIIGQAVPPLVQGAFCVAALYFHLKNKNVKFKL